MSLYAVPALYAMLLWWFSTGAILYLDGRPRRTFPYSMAGATLVFALALVGMVHSRDDTTETGAYCAFTCGLLAWAWQEAAFYLGYITGPLSRDCAHGAGRPCRGWRHFGHAVRAILYHELVIILSAAVIFWITRGAANQFGLWTFLLLWVMQLSAKLNVFLGVRNVNEEFIPEHLAFLRAFLTRKPMNGFFPVSITLGTLATVLLARRVGMPDATPLQVVGFVFLTTMMGLAVVEHWFLILPLPFAALWRWALSGRHLKPWSRNAGVRASRRMPTSELRIIPPPAALPATGRGAA